LLVYIHGFMGTETSFKSFPAHVHSLLTLMLADSHVVHTKIYPRYQSRKNISFARDAFSNWLYPHESDTTDVILLGHSLGGILGAEVIILPSHAPRSHELLQHRILGLIAFDTPFLGMHPGVVSTGLASLFRGAPESPQSLNQDLPSSNPSEVFDASQNDPNYNPAFPNDVHIPVRKNKWDRAWYFLNKHADDLRQATQSYVKSHLEFGGCMADYPGLRKRYEAIRVLEDVDEMQGNTTPEGYPLRRVRFVNYYTASTGRIKEKKLPENNEQLVMEAEMQSLRPEPSNNLGSDRSRSVSPRISVQEYRDGDIVNKIDDLDLEEHEPEMIMLEPRYEEGSDNEAPVETLSSVISPCDDLPPIPPMPEGPGEFDPTSFKDPEALKPAQKEHERLVKAHEQAKKDREKAVKAREKLISKRDKAAIKEQERIAKQERQEQARLNKEKMKRKSTLNPEAYDDRLRQDEADNYKSEKKKRDRKFCTLPTKNPRTGIRDPAWVRVYMEGVDEVVAHTTLFIVSDTYAKLVGDTAERIIDWVHEDATTKAVMEERALGAT
jgi:pimeloyl-ACP methyl ester carboxylesterase